MRKTLFGALAGALVLLTVLAWSLANAKEDPANPPKREYLAKTNGTPLARPLNINNFVTWMKTTGQGNWTTSNKDGGIYPRGTSNVIYQDGFEYGGIPYLDAAHTVHAATQPELRCNGQSYNVGTREGWITGSGANAAAIDPSDPGVRMYRIRRDYASMSVDELRRDAGEVNEKLSTDVTQSDMDAIVAAYAKDWTEWPVALGAPYVERNGHAGYQAPPAFNTDPTKGKLFTVDSLISGKYDEPGIAGADPNSPADQVMWNAFNDLDAVYSQGLWGCDGLGLEFQCTIWGYKRADALGNLYFKKYRVINKGGIFIDAAKTQRGSFYIDSLYFCQWSDPDLGGSGDDLCGCDTTLSIGFIYNGNAIDSEYKKYSIPPPAAAYDFLQGPIVASPGDNAVFDLKIRPGFKNLPMTSFCFFSAGSAISDPAFTFEGAKRWYNMFKGYVPDPSTSPHRYYPAGPFLESQFPLSGDPVTQKGFVDGLGTDYSLAPGDRRFLLNSGPVELAPGDTQEVVVGVVGGLGSDRLSSVAVMKFNDEFVQNTFNALFAVPKPPPAPAVSVAELDEKVIIEWASTPQRTADIENVTFQPGTYTFEGYNVYQLPNQGSALKDGKRIAVYDLPSDPAIVLDRQFDVATGLILQVPVQFGTNSGIKRQFVLDRDFVKDVNKLYNGTEYYIAVTAYTVSRGGFSPAALESSPIILRVVPHSANPGTRFTSTYGDTVKNVTQTALPGGSLSEGLVIPIVVNPAKLTGHQYKVTFKIDTSGNNLWDLTDVTLNKVILSNQLNQTGDDNYAIADGMMVKVSGPSNPGMKSWSIPSGTRRFSPVGGFIGLGLEGFSTSADPVAYDVDNGTIGMAGHLAFGAIGTTLTDADYHNVLLKLAAVDNVNLWDPKATPSDTNFSRGYRYLRAATAAAQQPSFAPWIVNVASGYPYQGYDYSVPFSAWDMETTPPTRLAVGCFENNVPLGAVDGRYWPGITSVDNSVTREFAFIFKKAYTTTADPALAVNMSGNATTPLMWVMTCARRAEAAWTAGDQFLITANHLNTPKNVFAFTAPTTTVGDATLSKVDVGRVGVYPNPYYAFNPQESSTTVKFVTFNKLPARATLRIFNLAGQMVRVLEKNDASQFLRWDLNNKDNFPVASGMYIVYVDMPEIGATKILKVAIIQEQEVPAIY
jgi:hypothetical protein